MSRRNDQAYAADRRPNRTMANRAVKVPVFRGRLVVDRAKSVCFLADREVEIEAPGKLLASLARRCDGRASLDEVLETLARDWNRDDLDRLIDDLTQQGVLGDARDMAAEWWTHVRNPGCISGFADPDSAAKLPEEAKRALRLPVPGVAYRTPAETPFSALLKRRLSLRTFAEAAVPQEALLGLLWAAYGAGAHRTVPSAGGIYPLQVHLVNLRATGDLERGVYRVTYLDDGRIGMEPTGGETHLAYRAFWEPDKLDHAQGIIVVSGALGRTALKYEARAALYVPLEAGHAAQNVLLAATEAGLAAVEYGGFEEDRLAALVQLGTDAVPLTSVIFGAFPTPDQQQRAESAPELGCRWVDTGSPAYAPPFFTAAVRTGGPDAEWSWGRSADPRLAYVKAAAEAQERRACSMPSGLREARIGDLVDAIPPQSIVAYSAEQYARPDFPYLPFDAGGTYLWKEGRAVLGGARVSVLADCLYFSDFIGRERLYTSASSSGAAAYTSEQGAIERAVLELIERDAFMVNWLSRASRPTVDPASLPAGIVARLRALNDAGVDVVVKDHSLGLAPVMLVFAQSAAGRFTLTTAGSAFDAEEALESALTELEAGVATRLAIGTPRALQPDEVETPQDHMDLYAQRRYYRRADFLGRDGQPTSLSEVGRRGAKDWNELCSLLIASGYEVLWFDLTLPGASLHQGRTPLHVGRAIIPGMIPISFGRGQEPLASFAARKVAGVRRQRHDRSSPAQDLFPHPFG